MRRPSNFFILIWTLLACAQAWATPAIDITPSFTRADLDPKFVDTWEKDVEGHASDFLNATPEQTGQLRFGYIKKPVWLRFALNNPEKQARTLILAIEPALIEELSLTEMTPSGQIIETAGFNLQNRVQAGALFRRRPTFKITLPPQEITFFLLRLSSAHSMDIHLNLATPELESRSALNDNLGMGAYYGIFFIILLLNLLIYFATRDRLYLSYFCFLVALGMLLSCLNGLLDFTFGGSGIFARHLGSISSAALIFGVIFCREFLQTKIIAPRLDRAQIAIAVFAGIVGLLHFTRLFSSFSDLFGIAIDIALGIAILLIFASTAVALKRGYQPAIFFLIAWGSFLALAGFYFSAIYGITRGSSFTPYAVQIGSTAEMILLSLALVQRVYLLKKAKTEAEEKARETDKLRSLVHIICHDLRNPLTVISGLAQAYLRRGHQEWAPIVRAAQSQQDILDYVRLKESLELGKLPLELVPVLVSDAVENARFLFESRIQEKKLQWQTHIEPNCPALADRTLLIHTVIANLVSNAIKFTPTGGRIELKAFSSNDRVQVEVQDNGVGIPADLLPHVFSNQASTTRVGTDGERGNGFGMPLVKTVVESFGGTLSIQSRCAGEVSDGSPSGTRIILSLQHAGQNTGVGKSL